jgi:hypothetical protein
VETSQHAYVSRPSLLEKAKKCLYDATLFQGLTTLSSAEITPESTTFSTVNNSFECIFGIFFAPASPTPLIFPDFVAFWKTDFILSDLSPLITFVINDSLSSTICFSRLSLNLFKKDNVESNVILISTQVIEVGIDITSDIMHTEISSIDSFLQRIGRCARYQNEKGEIYVYDVLNGGDSKYLPYNETVTLKTYEYLKKIDGEILTQKKFNGKNIEPAD